MKSKTILSIWRCILMLTVVTLALNITSNNWPAAIVGLQATVLVWLIVTSLEAAREC